MVSRLFPRTSRTLLAAALAGCFAAPVFASGTDYYVVVPMPGKVASAPASPITVTLNAYTLPAGTCAVKHKVARNKA